MALKNFDLCVPYQAEAINEEFFARDAVTVARDLLGRTLVRERFKETPLYARLVEVAAYEGRQEDSMVNGVLAAPATIVVSAKYGKYLLDVATGREDVPSCITFRAALVGNSIDSAELVMGPGKLTQALRIEPGYDGIPLSASGLWIGGDRIDEARIKKRNLSNLPENCQGYFYVR